MKSVLCFVFVFVSLFAMGQHNRKDSLIKATLPYNASEISIAFDFEVVLKGLDAKMVDDKLDHWIEIKGEKGLLMDVERVNERQMNAQLFEDIRITKKDIPVKMIYSIHFIKEAGKLKCLIHGIKFQNYPGGKENEKLWMTAAEEAIVDEHLYNRKGKLNKLRAEYKVETLLVVERLSHEVSSLFKAE